MSWPHFKIYNTSLRRTETLLRSINVTDFDYSYIIIKRRIRVRLTVYLTYLKFESVHNKANRASPEVACFKFFFLFLFQTRLMALRSESRPTGLKVRLHCPIE